MAPLIRTILILLVGIGGLVSTKNAHAQLRGSDLCGVSATEAERILRLPPYILQAIALTESGRWDAEDQRRKPWPWAVGAEGKSWYFGSKQQALDHVKELQDKGATNIDIGCMQINLYYHGTAFQSLSEAFNPVNNVAYAGIFLSELYDLKKSWNEAVKFYHSATPKYNRKYIQLVFNNWQKLREQAEASRSRQPQIGIVEAEPQTPEDAVIDKPEESQNLFLPSNEETRETQSILLQSEADPKIAENLFRYDAFARVQAAQLFERRFPVDADSIPPSTIPERNPSAQP